MPSWQSQGAEGQGSLICRLVSEHRYIPEQLRVPCPAYQVMVTVVLHLL